MRKWELLEVFPFIDLVLVMDQLGSGFIRFGLGGKVTDDQNNDSKDKSCFHAFLGWKASLFEVQQITSTRK
jgi:hypothetical protein